MIKVKATCYICSSDRFVDDHHVDCMGGKLSPETVPLCRRCHRTYHDLGVDYFDDEYLDKAIEIENKFRVIHNANLKESVRHKYIDGLYSKELQPMKLEDVKRSRYWYKKHHITPPARLGRIKPSSGITVRIPNNPPLCGEDWLKAHLTDHTCEEIEALAIEIAYDNRWLPPVSIADKRGTVKAILKGRAI